MPESSPDSGSQQFSRELVVAIVAVVLSGIIAVLISQEQISESRRQVDSQLEESRRQVEKQLAASRRQVEKQLSAARTGRIADLRADTYAEFVASIEEHLGAIGDSEAALREADRQVFVALALVDLRGSPAAYGRASGIASRARELTNASLSGPEPGESRPVGGKLWFGQQRALRAFVEAVRDELRR